jgi:hypothetical protein
VKCPLSTNLPAGLLSDCSVILVLTSLSSLSATFFKNNVIPASYWTFCECRLGAIIIGRLKENEVVFFILL